MIRSEKTCYKKFARIKNNITHEVPLPVLAVMEKKYDSENTKILSSVSFKLDLCMCERERQ